MDSPKREENQGEIEKEAQEEDKETDENLYYEKLRALKASHVYHDDLEPRHISVSQQR